MHINFLMTQKFIEVWISELDLMHAIMKQAFKVRSLEYEMQTDFLPNYYAVLTNYTQL